MEIPGQGGSKTGVKRHLTKEQRTQIVQECVEDQVSPADLARKWKCRPETIRAWVRKAGKQLPRRYKKINTAT